MAGEPVDLRTHKYGFREVKIVGYNPDTKRGPFILLNGVPLKICGVNRHDFHPDYGHAVPERMIRSDLELLKRSNITNVPAIIPIPAGFMSCATRLAFWL